MDQITLTPIKHMTGEIRLPGSKSLSNRALLLSALASGSTTLENLLKSEDTQIMVKALRQLHTTIELSEDWQQCVIHGHSGLFQPPSNTTFFLGNAGTAIRPLTSILSLIPGTFTVDGDQYMRRRPIAHLVDALAQLGAKIDYLQEDGYPPLKIIGGDIKAGNVNIEGNISSQYLTSLLLTLPMLEEHDSRINVFGEQVSKPYLDLTLDIMQKFGVHATHEDYHTFTIPGGQQYCAPGRYLVEGDASSASYFFAAAAIAGGPIRVYGIGENSIQGDIAFLDVIETMGAQVQRTPDWIEIRGGQLTAVDLDLNHIPDAAMTVAAMALFARGKTRIRNIYNWRVKETDRMHAMATELRKLGANVDTGEDYLVIDPPDSILPATIDTYGDHRIAMSFSLAALGDAEIIINDPDCTAKTFPDYFNVFASLAAP
ncbi:MAG: 3-phosphoshikimate 1-carboxyvinyltransferase [Pseudomonadales bacterium]